MNRWESPTWPTLLGDIAWHRRITTSAECADRLWHRVRAARLDNSDEVKMRKLCASTFSSATTSPSEPWTRGDRRRLRARRAPSRASTVVTSDRDPVEWLTVMADPLLTRSAIDRLESAAYELVIKGESYRRRPAHHRRADS